MRVFKISTNWRYVGLIASLACVQLAASGTARAQALYSESFEVDPTANWTVNLSGVAESDETANFFFDYSTVGIPKAPNSASTDGTRGMNLQANRDSNSDGIGAFSGFSVSPNGQDFSNAGDYKLTFDWWPNFPGPAPLGSSGTSQLSTFGIGTSGTFSNWPGRADGIYFAATLDGGSASDYRVYSQERQVSYQVPFLNPQTDIDAVGNPIDSHALHVARSRNNTPPPADYNDNGTMDAADYVVWRDNLGLSDPATAPLRTSGNGNFDLMVDQADYDTWRTLFGSKGLYSEVFGGVSPPAAQTALFPQQTGSTAAGSPAFEWHEVEIAKIGKTVTWTVDGTLLIALDTTNFVSEPAGGNILFGHSDINAGVSMDPERFNLLFTLIDNVRVSTISPGSGAHADSVPEPGCGLLCIFAALGGLAIRWRRCPAA